jgi:hypothetical protein
MVLLLRGLTGCRNGSGMHIPAPAFALQVAVIPITCRMTGMQARRTAGLWWLAG